MNNTKGYTYPLRNICAGPVTRLRSPLLLPSLHMMGEADAAIPPEQSLDLADAFATTTTGSGSSLDGPMQTSSALSASHLGWQRQILRHGGGHCVPQRAADVAAILEFLEVQQRRSIAPTGWGAFRPSLPSVALKQQQGRAADQNTPEMGPLKAAVVPEAGSGAGPKGKLMNNATAHPTTPVWDVASLPPASISQLEPTTAAPSSPPCCCGPSQESTAAADPLLPTVVRARPSSSQTAASVVPGGFRAPEEQLEELEALEAIFGEEYVRLSGMTSPSGDWSAVTPLVVRIRLREPGADDDGAGAGGGGGGGGEVGPSRRFSLVFTLPEVGGFTRSSAARWFSGHFLPQLAATMWRNSRPPGTR